MSIQLRYIYLLLLIPAFLHGQAGFQMHPKITASLYAAPNAEGDLHIFTTALWIPKEEFAHFYLPPNELSAFKSQIHFAGAWSKEANQDYTTPIDTIKDGIAYKYQVLHKLYLIPTKVPNAQIENRIPLIYAYVDASFSKLNGKEAQQPIPIQKKDTLYITLPECKIPTHIDKSQFLHGVGNLSMSASLSDSLPFTGDPVTLRVTITGKGNLPLLLAPFVQIPSEFSIEEPVINTAYQVSDSGIVGSVNFLYEMFPVKPGNYKIPPVRFMYFNTQTQNVDSIISESFTLKITGDDKTEQFLASSRDNFYPSAIKNAKTHLRSGRQYMKWVVLFFLVSSIGFVSWMFLRKGITNTEIRGK